MPFSTPLISIRSLLVLGLTAIECWIPHANAANYSLWVHGRSSTAIMGNYQDFSYWGPKTTSAGVNKRAVNWDGKSHISEQNPSLRAALDCYCTGNNWCYIAAHSAGNLMIGYALAQYGSSVRHVKTPDSAGGAGNTLGTCTAVSSGATQTGWNIKFVDVAGGAAGGSELADDGSWTTSQTLVDDLKTATARAMYNHNSTRSHWFYLFTGAKGTLTGASIILPGEDDGAVAYHSSGGMSGSSGGSYKNAGSSGTVLPLGTAAASNGKSKWSWHSVKTRDDNSNYNHFANGNWLGVVGLMRSNMVSNAK